MILLYCYLKPVLEEKDAFHIAGLMTLVKDNRRVISELWEMFAQELDGIGNRVKPEEYYGISYYPEDWENSGFFYMAAIEIESPGIMKPTLVFKTIPPLRCARFIHKGLLRDLQLTLDYIYQIWLPKSGKTLSFPVEIEYYGRDFRGSDGEESERGISIPIEDPQHKQAIPRVISR